MHLIASLVAMGCDGSDTCTLAPIYQEVEVRPQAVRLVHDGDDLLLFAMGLNGLQWRAVHEDGRLGEPVAERLEAVPAGFGVGMVHGIVSFGGGRYRIYGERSSFDVDTSTVTAETVPYAFDAAEAMNMERLWRIGESLYAVYGYGSDTQWTAGLAQVSEHALIPLGEPFYEGARPQGVVGLRVFGGWDDQAGRLLIDLRHQRTLLSMDLAGVVLESTEYPGHAPYLLWWTQLADGSFTGMHGASWYVFDPRDRENLDPIQLSTEGASPRTTVHTQVGDGEGGLWAAVAEEPNVTLWRRQAGHAAFSSPVSTEVIVRECGAPPLHLRD